MTTQNTWYQAENHLAGTDEFMAALVARYGPCPLQPRADYFTQLCKSIVSQQLSTKSAAAIFGRFSSLFGHTPTAAEVAATPRETLREQGLSQQKITYLYDLAAKVADGTISLEHFAALPDEEVITQLVQVKGVGVWTAQMFLIFALNRPDVLPTDDFGVRKAIMQGYCLEAMPGKLEMELIAEPWRPWRSIASWYLWRSLENT
ncbi:MAG: DNA-3-methyladenine glycosylase [Negativicutes bacterium]|nr:DNA-3-methyladenine glycosylase [Negativicutes bacterium]